MRVRRFSVSVFVGLLVPGLVHGQPQYGKLTLGHVDAQLAPVGQQLTIPFDQVHVAGTPWANSGDRIVVKGPSALRIIDSRDLRVVASIPFHGFLCMMSFDGPNTLVVLSGCDRVWRRHFIVRRLDLGLGRVISKVRTVRMDPLNWPVSFAYGDGTVFAALRERGVDAIDAQTGAVHFHPFIRTLSKESGYVATTWLGNHRLALGTSIVDVRTWQLDRHLRGGKVITVAGDYLLTWGTQGVGVYTRGGRFLRHVLGNEQVGFVNTDGRMLYALVGMAYDVVDLTTGKRQKLLPQYFNELLAP